jgi:NAD(P)-dependent dehydrogenase (short-subunit alcohol dehydrogenase family)
MKILIVGSSSDIARKLIENSNEFEFIELSSSGEEGHQHRIDLLDETTFPELNDQLDGFIYFPGSINLKPFSNLKEKDFKNDYDINVLGLVKTLKHYQNNLSKGASVVFISSIAAQVGMPFHSSIAMCKSAIEGLTRSLAAEWSPSIRVNCIAPSVVQTKLSKRLFRTDHQIDQMNQRHPLQRHGETADIAHAIKFLLSEKSSWMTGQVMKIDGGLSTLKK